jgi:hypothetical protein
MRKYVVASATSPTSCRRTASTGTGSSGTTFLPGRTRRTAHHEDYYSWEAHAVAESPLPDEEDEDDEFLKFCIVNFV